MLMGLVGDGGVVDTTAPTITSSNTASVNENATLSHSLTASESVTWSIVGGADQAQFEISGSTLRWSSNGTRDYEAPADANTDNAYIVQVRATDLASNTTDQTITVSVSDVFEATTFDGAAQSITKSNGDLTATHSSTNNNSGTRSLSFQTSGKYYFEVTATDFDGSADCAGVLAKTGNFIDLISAARCGSVTRTSGNVFGNDAASGKSIGAIADGDVLGFAVDLDNAKIWARKAPSGNWNGLAIGSENPATNTGGVSISNDASGGMAPAVGFGGASTQSGDNATANFGATSFSGTAPSGFTAGWPKRVGGPEWLPAVSVTMSSDNGGWNGFTLRNVVSRGGLAHAGSKYRITFEGGSVEGTAGDACYSGPGATSGDVYDFETTPTQVLFSGGGSFDTGVGGTIMSDEINVAVDASKPFIVAFHFNNAAKDTIRRGSATNANYYWKSANEPSTVDVTGYTTVGSLSAVVKKIEVWG